MKFLRYALCHALCCFPSSTHSLLEKALDRYKQRYAHSYEAAKKEEVFLVEPDIRYGGNIKA